MMRLVTDGLSVSDADGRLLLAPLDVAVAAGSTISLIGESGAGKSLFCAAVAGLLSPELRMSGRIVIDGQDVTALSPRDRRALWSRTVFLLPQEPWTALAPARRVRAQIADMPRLHDGLAGRTLATAAGRLLSRVGLSVEREGDHRPRMLSGGMAQRAAIATALGAPAGLVLVDEPTKGLDAPLRDRVRDNIRLLRDEGRALVVVTHDLALARDLGGQVLVLRDGVVVEQGPAERILTHPAHPFTRALLDAEPQRWRRTTAPIGHPAIAFDAVEVRSNPSGPALARSLSFAVPKGAIVGLCGPSGSGKTTIGNVAIGLTPPASGTVSRLAGEVRRYQKLYQDPGAAFAPWRSVRATMADALAAGGLPRASLDDRFAPLAKRLRLSAGLLNRRPGSVSGGELQRLALARALLVRPVFLFADEPTSRLDPLTQREVALLLTEVAADGVGCLLASHDPALIAALASTVLTLGGDGTVVSASPAPELR